MNDLGKGVAVAGIWIAVGAIGWKNPEAATAISIFAFLATAAVYNR